KNVHQISRRMEVTISSHLTRRVVKSINLSTCSRVIARCLAMHNTSPRPQKLEAAHSACFLVLPTPHPLIIASQNTENNNIHLLESLPRWMTESRPPCSL